MTTQTVPVTGPARFAAGSPEVHSSLYWRIRFSVCDQVVLLELPTPTGTESVLILREH